MYRLTSFKKLFIIIFSFLIHIQSAFSQWSEVYSDTTHNINNIFSLNSDTCWVSGDKGFFMKSLDGGSSWNVITIDSTINFGRIYFSDYLNGYMLNDQGSIYRTNDGGNTWVKVISTISSCSGSFLFTNLHANNTDTIIFIAGCYPFDVGIYSSFDSAINFNQIPIPITCGNSGNYLINFLFTNDSIGYAAGADEALFKTVDNGLTWIQVHEECLGFGMDVFGLSCYNDSILWFGGSKNNSIKHLQYSIDGGNNWIVYNTNSQIGFVRDLAFFSDGSGYIINVDEDIFKTIDYGLTFNFQYHLLNSSPFSQIRINQFFFLNSQTGYAASTHSILKTTNGGGPVGIPENNSSGLIKLFPNPSSGEFTVSKFALFPGLWSVQIFDNFGKLVKQFFNLNENEIHINLSDYSSGLYFVKSICGKKSTSSKILIIK